MSRPDGDYDAGFGADRDTEVEFPQGPNVGRVFTAVAGFLGVGCTLYVVVLVGGVALLRDNPVAVAVVVALVVIAAGVAAWYWARRRRLPPCPTDKLRGR
jgi:hypothetical protein